MYPIPKRPPVCRVCGNAVLYGDLYCSRHYGAYAEEIAQIIEKLTEAGFVRDAVTPNLFRKDGVAVSLEGVARLGVERMLRQHGNVVEALQAFEAAPSE